MEFSAEMGLYELPESDSKKQHAHDSGAKLLKLSTPAATPFINAVKRVHGESGSGPVACSQLLHAISGRNLPPNFQRNSAGCISWNDYCSRAHTHTRTRTGVFAAY